MKLFYVLFLITFSSIHSKNVELVCDTKDTDTVSGNLTFGPSCNASGAVNLTEHDTITLSSNSSDKSYELLRLESKNVSAIPIGINKLCPNLKALVIYKSKLAKISLKDIKSLTNLVFLNLNYNLIEILENFLFSFNTNLCTILIKNNRIKFVHPTAFNGLKQLQTLDLRSNNCVNGNATNQSDFQNLIKEIELKCWTEPLEILRNMSILEMEASKIIIASINEILQQKLANMSNQMNQIQNQLTNQTDSTDDSFSGLFASSVTGKLSLFDVTTVVNSAILVLIIMAILILICKRKPKTSSEKFKALKIDHKTPENFSINKPEDSGLPINPIYDEATVEVEEELYSDISYVRENQEEQYATLEVDDSPIYAQVQKGESFDK